MSGPREFAPGASHGGPAFPLGVADPRESECGMSLRDYFAAHAMIGLVDAAVLGVRAGTSVVDVIAEDAYRLADAMLAARVSK